MAEERDEFAGESGLKDDYDGVIVDAWFSRSADVAGGNAVLNLKIVADDGEEVEQRYGCGADWDTYDGGASVVHPKDSETNLKGFNHQSKVQRLVKTTMELDNTGAGSAADIFKARSAANGKTGARHANIWNGLKFHWEIVSEDVKMKDRDNPSGPRVDVTVNTCLPSAYLGEQGAVAGAAAAHNAGAVASAGGQAGAPSTAAQGAVANSPTAIMDELEAGVAEQIVALAKAKDYNAFVDAAMEIPGVIENTGLMAALTDEAWYNTLRTG